MVKNKIINGVSYETHESWGLRSFNKDNKLHSFKGEPAIIDNYGSRFWYKDGKVHRGGDKPAVKYGNGSKFWYRNGEPHRDNHKPAIIEGNHREWYVKGVKYIPTKPNKNQIIKKIHKHSRKIDKLLKKLQ